MIDAEVAACAGIVERADPDRFRATMAAPVEARQMLFPLYAFNVEVSRAPWVTQEPMIAEMRLQWWRDALAEIAAGTGIRRHEVVTPLAGVIGPDQARTLDALVDARRWEIYCDPFPDASALSDYIDRTAGHLMCIAADLLGGDQSAVRDYAWAAGLANWFAAVPDLIARGRRPLPDDRPAAISELAETGLTRLARARAQRAQLHNAARSALLPGWRCGPILRRAADDPAAVTSGSITPGPMRDHWRFHWQAVTGRY